MAIRAFNSDFPADHLPLLRWLIFTGVSAFAFVMCWHFGLVRMMINGDKTYISVIIAILYVASSLHCLLRTTATPPRTAFRQSDPPHSPSKTGVNALMAGEGEAHAAFRLRALMATLTAKPWRKSCARLYSPFWL